MCSTAQHGHRRLNQLCVPHHGRPRVPERRGLRLRQRHGLPRTVLLRLRLSKQPGRLRDDPGYDLDHQLGSWSGWRKMDIKQMKKCSDVLVLTSFRLGWIGQLHHD